MSYYGGDKAREYVFQNDMADPNAANTELRTFGALGVLRHELDQSATPGDYSVVPQQGKRHAQ